MLKQPSPAVDVVNVTEREAAIRLGVSERRVRKLALDGRMRGTKKAGAEWLIPTPVEVIPGKRGPVGVAWRRSRSESLGQPRHTLEGFEGESRAIEVVKK